MVCLFCQDKKPVCMLLLPYRYSDGFKEHVPFPQCTIECMHYFKCIKIQTDVQMHEKHIQLVKCSGSIFMYMYVYCF